MSELTKDEVRHIFFAIDVAEGEIGSEFNDLKAKLYGLFPEIKAEHEQRERQAQYEVERQQTLRKEITEEFLNYINQEPYKGTVLKQLIEWYKVNEREVRSHYSDEICFPFDVWKYGDAKLVSRLAGECRKELERSTNFDKECAKGSDAEMVHGLIRILENTRYRQDE